MRTSPARLLLLLAAGVCVSPSPAGAADRVGILLYRFQAGSPAVPIPVANILAALVQDELQKRGRVSVLIHNPDDPGVRRIEAAQPTTEPTRLHHAISVARSMGARYLIQGLVTAYEAPQSRAPGLVTLRLTTASTSTEVSRDVFVTAEMKVSAKGTEAAKVLGPAARAAAVAVLSEAIPALDRATPADRAQAAEQARARGADASAAGVTNRAVQELRGAARLDPDDAGTHQALGEALVKQGLIASALLEFRQALTLERLAAPSEPPAGATQSLSPPGPAGSARLPADELTALRLRLVRGLIDRGLFDEAMAEARRGLEHLPDSVPLRLAMAEAAVRAADGTTALEALRPLHAGRPPRDAEWNLMAAAYALTGDVPHWLDAVVRGAVEGVSESAQYDAVLRRLDLAFRTLAEAAEDAERRMLAGQLSLSSFKLVAARRLEQTKMVSGYLERLAYPEGGEAIHEARQAAWTSLIRAAEQGLSFADEGNYNDLAAARGERLRALARLEAVHAR